MATTISAQAMLNAQLECGVCHEVFTDPRVLPCGHTFCLHCIQNVVTTANITNTKTHNGPCPLCRVEFSVHNLRDLPKNFALADLISSLPANSRCALHDDGDEHGPATHVCVQCWDALCTTCARAHTKTKLTKGHTVKLLSDITQDDITAHKARQDVYCEIKEHRQQKQQVTCYCETCNRFACGTCTSVKCRSHACLELSDADEKFTTQIRAALQPLLVMKRGIDDKLKNIRFAIKQLLEHANTVLTNMEDVFNGFEQSLKTTFERLLTHLQQCKHTAKLTVIKSNNEQVSQLQTSLADAQTTASSVQQQTDTIEQHLTPTSTVFDKLKAIKQLPSVSKLTNSDTAAWYQVCDTSVWQTEMKIWCQSITDKLASAAICLPRLTEKSLAVTRLSATSRVTSAKHTRNFTVEQNRSNRNGVRVLSVSSDGRLLVGQDEDRQLHVYSVDGSHVTSITLPNCDTVREAVWTPRGNIVCSTVDNKVVVMTGGGNVLHQTQHSDAWCLSVSVDNVIYLADCKTGVYQSTDDGVTWSHVFNAADGWRCRQAIKVSTDSDTDVFWTLELASEFRLRVYTVDKRRVGSNVTRRDVTLPSYVTLDWWCRLTYDGRTSIFVADGDVSCVHVWSVSGQYERQLMLPLQLTNCSPRSVAIDTRRSNVMYLGQENERVGVFELTYESQ